MSIAEKLNTIAENEPKIYEAGKKAQYDEFWDAFQDNGNRVDYYRAFGGVGFNDDTYKPKYNMSPTMDASGMFTKSRMTDIYKNINIDFSKVNNFSLMFNTSYVKSLREFNSTGSTNLTQAFQTASELITIEKLILKSDGSQTFNLTFNLCNKLENIEIEGVIGQNGFNVQWSPLTHDSLLSIINALADKSADTSGTTWLITLGSDNVAKLSDTERKQIQNKGWTYK